MTQETINKLYQLLNYKSKWEIFKNKFDFNQNIAIVKKCSDGVFCTNPDTDIVIYPECIDDWNDFNQYILKYVDEKINYYTEEIEKL